jgi:hypothetical protein
MPKQIRFMDYDDNIIESYINPENNVFISINRHKLNDDQVEYICLSKEDLKDFIEHLNNLHEQL